MEIFFLAVLFIIVNGLVSFLFTLLACRAAVQVSHPTRFQDILEDREVAVVFSHDSYNTPVGKLYLSHHLSNLPIEETMLYPSYSYAHDIVEDLSWGSTETNE